MKARLPVRIAILNRRTYEAPAEGRRNKIRLDFNENTTGCSEAARRALARISAKELAMYPEYESATKIFARYFRIHPEEIALTNGGDDALRVFFDTFVEPRSNILICEPTFPMYRYYAEIAGANVVALRYTDRMEFPAEEALKALRKKPRLFFLANPNNPTGTLVKQDVLRRLLKAATDTIVILDEAYSNFSGQTSVPWIRRYPQLFVAKTFSKAAGMAGLRLGAVLGQRESLALVRRALPPYPVNTAALVAGVAAIEEGKTIALYVREVKRLRTWLSAELEKRGAKVFPSSGNFVLAQFGPSSSRILEDLERAGILVRERKDVGPGFVRVTIGTQTELKKFLHKLPKLFRKADEQNF
jgi:histidinol-phosphate aminotransferase